MSDFTRNGVGQVWDAAAQVRINAFMSAESARNLENLRKAAAVNDLHAPRP
ncbi:MAG: hypothetical protein KDI13_02105 [Alphaproteobacteria bacterium]|nr:hypothetical protein [Alphaproteobacteria bacterium]MCB1782765.1 hypothetical protein [Alphaproteobacteria bacterium]